MLENEYFRNAGKFGFSPIAGTSCFSPKNGRKSRNNGCTSISKPASIHRAITKYITLHIYENFILMMFLYYFNYIVLKHKINLIVSTNIFLRYGIGYHFSRELTASNN